MKLELPYPPSVNHYWRHSRGRHYISDEGKEYRRHVAMLFIGEQDEHKHTTFTGRLAVTVTVYPPDKRRRDLDNTQKALLDALAFAGVYEDDSQIDDLRVVRGPVCAAWPHVEVEIAELG